MNVHALFQCYDLHCRQAGLGGGALRVERRDGYTVQIGPWIYVSSWAFEPARMDEIVGTLKREAHRLGRNVLWRVFDQDKPAGLAKQLAHGGFRPVSDDVLLAFDVSKPVPEPELETVEVCTEAQLDDYTAIVSQAFDEPLVLSADERRAYLTTQSTRSFITRNTAGAISAGQLDIAPANPAVLLRGGSTLAAHRGQGGFSAMVHARLRYAQRAGKDWAFVEARPTSLPILRRLGFIEIAQATSWVYSGGV